MDSNRNFWPSWWQADSAGSHLTGTEGDEEVFRSPTTPDFSVPNSDWQTLPGGESWQELEAEFLSLLHSDSREDHRRNASSPGPCELIENGTPSTNWELGSQFRRVLNEKPGRTSSSSEAWKDFLVVGDGDVATAPGPENLGLHSHATRDLLPKRDHASSIGGIVQNVNHRRRRKKIDGVKKIECRHRGPNWSLDENRSFLQHMEVEVEKGKPPWKALSEGLKAMNFDRKAKACEDHWGVLLADLKKFETHFGSNNILRDPHLWPSVDTMSREQRSQNGLPLLFEAEWFEAIARIVEGRSKHRKTRSLQHSKGRIHVAGTPSCPCRHQQSRVSAASLPASAATSSEIFNYDGDGVTELVKLLSYTDRNVTFDQIIEVRRMSLKAQEMDLRRREIEWARERERMYQGQSTVMEFQTLGTQEAIGEANPVTPAQRATRRR